MRNRETHFEQVSIKVVETVIEQAIALATLPEKSPAHSSTVKRPAACQNPNPESHRLCKGPR